MTSDTPNDTQSAPSAGRRQSDAATIAQALATLSEGQQLQVREARSRRRRTFWWRAIGLTILVLIALGGAFGREAQFAQPHVARVTIEGVIRDDPARDALLRRLATDENVQGVVVRINSGGGSVVGGEALYTELRALAAAKPVVAVLGEAAASAAYMTAIAADHIVSRENTATGSIGVIFTIPNFQDTLEAIGVRIVELRSGERKAQPSPYGDVDLDALDYEQALVDQTADWFLALVRERRGVDAAVIAELSDGRVVTGGQALELGLVDVIGGEPEALAWLAETHGVSRDATILDREIAPEDPSFLSALVDNARAGDPTGVLESGLFDAALDQLQVLTGPRLTSELQ